MLKARGRGYTTRSGGGGGQVAVNNTDCSLPNQVSASVSTIVIGDGLGFTAYQDPNNPSCVIIGQPPNFLPDFPFGVTNRATTPVRVGEPTGNFVAGLNENWVGTTRMGTQLQTISWQSGQCTGFGGTSSMRVEVSGIDLGTDYFDHSFPSAGNKDVTEGRVEFRVTGTTPDGDGSRDSATVRITVNLLGLLQDAGNGHTSGSFRVRFTHTDFSGAQFVFTEEFFLDDVNNNPPVVGNDLGDGTAFRLHVPVSYNNSIQKYISGIAYFTTGSAWTVGSGVIANHNLDSSRPTESILVETHGSGVADYTTSPWTQDAHFQYAQVSTKDRFDNQLAYVPPEGSIVINRTNFRHFGNSTGSLQVRDSWSVSPSYNSATQIIAVDTFTDNSTDLIETFNGESFRLQGDYATPWVSTTPLVNGEAAVFGGSLMQPSRIFTIDENVEGAAGSASNMTTYAPSQTVAQAAWNQPDYSGHTNSSVFFREFRAANPTTSYANMTFTITTRNGLASDLDNGLEIYLWKLGSSAPASPNLTLPPAHDTTNSDASKVNSIWVHKTYNFATFDDGATQSAATSGAQVNITGNTVTVSFGGANVEGGVLARIEVSNGVIVDHIVAAF